MARDIEKARERSRRWREAHPEQKRAESREYQRQRRANDPEYVERQRQRMRDADPQHLSEIRKRSYAKLAEKRRAERRDAYWADPERERAYGRAYWKANPDKAKEMNNRRRARIKGAPVVEKIDRQKIYDRDGGRCHICARHVSRSRFVLDHLVPLARGGEHSSRNLATAHSRCNNRRGAGYLPAQLRLVG